MSSLSYGRIALVEGDPNSQSHAAAFLSSQGFHVQTFSSGEDLIQALGNSTPFEMILIDLNLPGDLGLQFCEEIKKRAGSTPIIIITAEKDEMSAVRYFETGVDDFIRKPFGLDELNSRIQRVLRDSNKMRTPTSSHGIFIDVKSRRLAVGDKKIPLTRTELRIMQALLEQFGSIVSRESLGDEVGLGIESSDRTLDVHLSRIRSKLNQAGLSEISIQSNYGKGYILDKKNEGY